MKPNIIFVLLDGARWDRIENSFEFSDLRKDGIFINNVSTVFPYTSGSLNVIFSGQFGKENGVDGYYKVLKLKNSIQILPEILQNYGYFTARGLLNDKLLSPRGYDLRTVHNEFEDDLNDIHPKLINDVFQKANGKPVFLFLHFTRIHTFTVSEILDKYDWNDKTFYDLVNSNLKKYDQTIDEAGHYAKKITNTIKILGEEENTIIIFFSDHGTGVGERYGERSYGSFTYEETIRTFYLFTGSLLLKNKFSDKLRSTLDIMPTILELCKIDENLNLFGKSFAGFLTGETTHLSENPFTFSETGALEGPFPSPEHSNVFCIKTSNYKLIYYVSNNSWELFDLQKDFHEKNNLIGTLPLIEDDLKQKLLNWINR
ncbi:sulfatase family protein [Nitrosopumilus maritimus]|uniref:Sulfatase n=1 Tax=Nitrosopumilus maritimus (strain SCM1) TaxID=436308 RepID=A9A3D0_NITMS|nr:sulfatase-like hydrolase/transferase [Nitrosopumilus maritimus]ABX12559.1 sulfatase [Nitrosopumilus maritimus SCM1]